MKLVLAETKQFIDSISIISELVNEARFRISKDKIELIAMDPANVAMVSFKLLSSSFIEYEVESETQICVNLDSLKQILRRIKPADIMILESEKNKLKIQIKNETIRTFHLSLIDMEEKEQRIPDLKFPLRIQLPTMVFDEAIEDMSIVAESVALTASSQKLIIESEGNTNAARSEIPNAAEIDIKIAGTEEIKSKYSIEYLKKMIKASKLADFMTIQFNKDYPLKLDYLIKDKLELSFILAPRVSTD